MVYGIYQSAAGMQLNQYRQAVLANNLANLDTVGFKHDMTVVRERKVASREGLGGGSASDRVFDRMTGGSLVAPTVTSFEPGMIQVTGGELDAAIDGQGFFAVNDGGTTRYTRDGRFKVNDQGVLVTAGNRAVLDEQGRTIEIPREARSHLAITNDGAVRSRGETLGRIAVVDFQDRSLLCKKGSNLFEALGGQAQSVPARLQAGAIESSTVDPTKAMVSMIEVSRAYELNANMVKLADSTLGRAVNDIGRIR